MLFSHLLPFPVFTSWVQGLGRTSAACSPCWGWASPHCCPGPGPGRAPLLGLCLWISSCQVFPLEQLGVWAAACSLKASEIYLWLLCLFWFGWNKNNYSRDGKKRVHVCVHMCVYIEEVFLKCTAGLHCVLQKGVNMVTVLFLRHSEGPEWGKYRGRVFEFGNFTRITTLPKNFF